MITAETLKTPQGAGLVGGGVVVLLVTALLAWNTFQRVTSEWAAAEAWLAFHNGDDGQARTLLGAMRDDRPLDPLPRLLLGAYEADRSGDDATRLQAATRLFDEAWGLEPSNSAAIGRAVVRLRAAVTKPADQRAPLLAEVDEILRQLGNDPDAAPLKAGLALLRNKPDEARKLLEGTPPVDASLEATGAWHWNRAAAMCLTRDGRALDEAMIAYQLRQFPEPEVDPRAKPEPADPAQPPSTILDGQRLLTLAARVALADPGSGKPEELGPRCDRARAGLSMRFSGKGKVGGRGRYLPSDGQDEAIIWNAVGLGCVRAGKFPEASAAFEAARKANDKEPLYALNIGEARRLEAEALPVAQVKERQKLFMLACGGYQLGFDRLVGKPGREEATMNAVWNLCVASIDGGTPRVGLNFYFNTRTKFPVDEVQRDRDVGAMYDHARNGGDMVKFFEKAIAKGHPDSAAMQKRIRQYQAYQAGSGRRR
jgi:hypothetical protein